MSTKPGAFSMHKFKILLCLDAMYWDIISEILIFILVRFFAAVEKLH